MNTTASLPGRHEKYLTWNLYQCVHRIAQCIAAELIFLPDVVPGMTDEINAAKLTAVPLHSDKFAVHISNI